MLLLVAKNKIIDIVTVCFKLRFFVIRIVIPTISHGSFSIVNCHSMLSSMIDFVLKGRIPLPNRMNFWKCAKGGGSFSIPKFMLQIFGTLNRTF